MLGTTDMELKSSTCEPDDAQTHNNLGVALRSRGALEEAAKSFMRSLAHRPDYAQAHYNLGVTLQDQGKLNEALVSYRKALIHKTDYADALYGMGEILCDLGEPEAAALHLHRCLKSDPDDSLGASFFLASLGRGPTPKTVSSALLQRLYAKRAHFWDGVKGYRSHELLATAVRKSACQMRRDILDAGCGTGLVGSLIGDLANKLDGIDMSSAMLEKAYQKRIYTLLYEGDLISFMEHNASCYDVIASAATLIHFGDLEPVFDAAVNSLRRGGLFAFTAYSNDTVDRTQFAVSPHLGLAKGGCYAHGSEYVVRTAKSSGFAIETFELGIPEHRPGTDVPGFVVTMRRC